MKKLNFLFLLLASFYVSYGQTTTDESIVGTIPWQQWNGKKIILMPLPSHKQQYDYIDIYGGKGVYGRLKYSDFVGQTATVNNMHTDSLGEMTFDLLAEDGNTYIATSRAFVFSRILLQQDMSLAQQSLQGKTFWLKNDIVYTKEESKGISKILKGQRFKQVTIEYVQPSLDDNAPIEAGFTLPNGTKAFVNINLSNNNVKAAMQNKWTMAISFYNESPRKTYPWPANIWDEIEAHKIAIDFTKEQVIMSWGEPLEIIPEANNIELWRWKSGSEVRLKNGKVI